MPKEKDEVDLELLKKIIEGAGLSTADLISRLADIGALSSCDKCDPMCTTCKGGCSNGPAKESLERYINPAEMDRLKQEILAELKR